MTDKTFKDHFSSQSGDYRKYRPVYPEALYKFLAEHSLAHDCAWDCATGNGQAAMGLAKHFMRVIATDASRQQLGYAMQENNIEYRCVRAEKTCIEQNSVDLITVAQALHWFDVDAFYQEARRVLKNQGVIAVWSYNLLSISVDIDQIISHLYADILASRAAADREWLSRNTISISAYRHASIYDAGTMEFARIDRLFSKLVCCAKLYACQ
jgi:ubiquinone/menaquinone biosynthesis C-methylase UbiE